MMVSNQLFPMTPDHPVLETFLAGAGLAQIVVAVLNFRLERILRWEDELSRLPSLIREVFHVHKWFISISLLIFAIITLRFVTEMATGATEMSRWIAAGIGIFWSIRTALQWCYYGHGHWVGKPRETAVHWILTVGYSGLAATYLVAALG